MMHPVPDNRLHQFFLCHIKTGYLFLGDQIMELFIILAGCQILFASIEVFKSIFTTFGLSAIKLLSLAKALSLNWRYISKNGESDLSILIKFTVKHLLRKS